MSEPHVGGCQCGRVRYALTRAPRETYVCHCRSCQQQSASAFGISVIVAQDALELTAGEPRFWSRPTDTGRTLDCAFCPDCGTRLWHRTRGSADVVSVKGGSLDDPVDLRGVPHIWTARKLPGVIVPDDSEQYPGEP
jgi:hypothetical protein